MKAKENEVFVVNFAHPKTGINKEKPPRRHDCTCGLCTNKDPEVLMPIGVNEKPKETASTTQEVLLPIITTK